MCTMIAHQAKIEGRGKSGQDWFEVREANVSYDHPYDLPLEHALNIDFVNEAAGPGARVAVELSIEAARKLVQTIEAVLAQAEQRGVAEDLVLGEMMAGMSLKRLVTPQEVAATVRFLASPAAATIAGQAIAVDGDTQQMA